MNGYNYLYIALISTFVITFSTYGMTRTVPENLLIQLEEDAHKKVFTYQSHYFEPIANKIAFLSTDPSNVDPSLLSKYKKQLDFHANKYIQSLAENKFHSMPSKLVFLAQYFPPDNTLLKKYFNQGKLAIEIAGLEREISKDEKRIAREEKQLEDQRKKEQKLLQEIQEEEEQIKLIEQQLEQEEKEYLSKENLQITLAQKKDTKEKELSLLTIITNQQPLLKEQKKHLESLTYTPQYFQGMSKTIKLTKDELDKASLIKQLTIDASIFINQVADDQTLNLEKKLKKIESYLSSKKSLFFLNETFEKNKKYLIDNYFWKELEEEEKPLTERVEELSEEEYIPKKEESKSQQIISKLPEQLFTQQPQEPQQQTMTPLKPEIPQTEEPEPTPNIFYQFAASVLNGITNFFTNVYSFFSWIGSGIFGKS